MEEHLHALMATLGHPVAWGTLPQGTGAKRISMFRVSGVDGMALQGPTGVVRGRVQIDCYGASYRDAIDVSRQVNDLLAGYRGGPIMTAHRIAIRDTADEAGGDVLQRVSLDYLVLWTE